MISWSLGLGAELLVRDQTVPFELPVVVGSIVVGLVLPVVVGLIFVDLVLQLVDGLVVVGLKLLVVGKMSGQHLGQR